MMGWILNKRWMCSIIPWMGYNIGVRILCTLENSSFFCGVAGYNNGYSYKFLLYCSWHGNISYILNVYFPTCLRVLILLVVLLPLSHLSWLVRAGLLYLHYTQNQCTAFIIHPIHHHECSLCTSLTRSRSKYSGSVWCSRNILYSRSLSIFFLLL